MSNSITTSETICHQQQLPPWVDDFLAASSPRRGSFAVLDDDQLISMFSDDSALPELMSSEYNSNDNEKVMQLDVMVPMQEHDKQPKNEAMEVGTELLTPRRVKRILANRQSAQKSRVRKLQYVSELERNVTSLQTEVSILSPRVAFLDHQRLILNVDNSSLKQRIAALAQDKIFKDGHQEALKMEIERLRQIYQHQNLHKMGNSVNNNGHSLHSQPPPQPQPPYSTSSSNSISALGM
ncbi:PREDICTED: basic leucine zipper 34-like isoform X2 [Lupinus angustifolius]|uniref:basic leucine zipper 34-like isoform X1 n=1 Tax=Lupinus angustifolius TaxID=3871 RepID=UPI00092F475E|nr:PREDICTED: basic leucine zipper 34-like isoform X1 [Lupinus angustifolius]XP_019449762.1 PREDICTED: basic leucine zipper 34-like isoform X2 [Lupinus angustifolius]